MPGTIVDTATATVTGHIPADAARAVTRVTYVLVSKEWLSLSIDAPLGFSPRPAAEFAGGTVACFRERRKQEADMESLVIRPSLLRTVFVIGIFVLMAGSFWSEAVEDDDPAMGVIAALLTILCCYLVAGSLRTAVRADWSGVTVAVGLSQRRHFDWPEIADFRVGRSRHGPVVYLVPRDGASMVLLGPTLRYRQSAVEHQVAELRRWLLR